MLQMLKWTHVKPPLEHLHWLPAEQHIRYKMTMLTFKFQSKSTPAYINNYIQTHLHTEDFRSSTTPMLFEPFTKTNYIKCTTCCSAPDVWNSQPRTVIEGDTVDF